MSSPLIEAFLYDANGYFDGQTAWQVVSGEVLKCDRSTDVCPWGRGVFDDSVFYRFDGKEWKTEKKPTCAADFVGLVVSHTSMTSRDVELRRLIQEFSNEDGFRQERGENLEWMIVKIPEPTPEEKAAQQLETAKQERSCAVNDIVVEVDGMRFDGDEKSQERMSRKILTMNDQETVQWVLADNTIANVSKAQLKQALRLAGERQTELWVVPYANAQVLI